ncbi:MAG: hypothetical protein OXQ31_09920 [Spirochaetaceae bacterium]|nr:hypothetical protein [Spirochaetaceae bacterium]
MNLCVLSEDQVEFYRGNDYLHAQGVLPGDLLQLGRKILARWAVRWSLDVRYKPTDRATETGKKQGFRARSRDPRNVVTYQQWLRQWEGIPPGAY